MVFKEYFLQHGGLTSRAFILEDSLGWGGPSFTQLLITVRQEPEVGETSRCAPSDFL